MKKPRVDRPVIVEGRYDKIKLDSILDADIFTTDGFGIFNQKEKMALFARLAEERGIADPTEQQLEELADEAWDLCPPDASIDFRMSLDKKNKYRI